MRKFLVPLIIILTVIIATLAIFYESIITQVSGATRKNVILIDPGHGGLDGGAESSDGTPEKDINLAISLYIKLCAQKDGWRVVMTRDSDEGLYGNFPGSIRSFKVEDLSNRKKLIDRTRAEVSVSVHLNSFKEDPGVSGAQVFYPSYSSHEGVCADSKKLAETVQSKLVEGLNPVKARTAMTKQGVKIIEDPCAPIIIVECGFLSNYEDSQMLKTKNYQQKIAQCIYNGIMEFSGRKPLEKVEVVD